MDNRDIYINRIKEDLIGPKDGLNEIIDEIPSERYYCGIIYPIKTEFSKEDDVGNDQVISGNDAQDEVFEEKLPLYSSYKPSTAGISFDIRNKIDKNLSLEIELKYAKYKREEKLEEIANEKTEDLINQSKKKIEYVWRREQISLTKDIDFMESKIKLTNDCELFIRKIEFKTYSTVTLQIINIFTNDNNSSNEESFINSEENTLFQVELNVKCTKNTEFKSRKSKIYTDDEDSKSSELIYRNIQEYATGHNCSSSWDELNGKINSISLEWFPISEVKGVDSNGDDEIPTRSAWELYNLSEEELKNSLNDFTRGYSDWIKKQTKISTEINLNENESKQASINLDKCNFALKRMQEGIRYICKHEDAMQAFKLANYAMQIQYSWAAGNMDIEHHLNELKWRPFQLAFVLMTLVSSSERSSEERDIFDLIWFPTGGGKTEAYLLLSAYVIFLRRLRFVEKGLGLAVIMRYTLRTLTIQQFQRAASMITACDMLRKKKFKSLLGNSQFSIGLWVGQDSTPNSIQKAKEIMNDEYSQSTPKQIRRCPCCKDISLNWRFEKLKLICECNNTICPIDTIPLSTIDEQLYDDPPSLLIGTVDKFAMMVQNERIANFFGFKNNVLPPDLIIQDELHLISGPLGSITGLYEIALDYLCANEEGKCKIIGSTATIRQASKQINALYHRRSFQFPPSGIDESNSGFAKKDENSPGRIYLGINSAGNSPKYILQAISASLLQASKDQNLIPDSKKFYSTLVAYFNSIKELGGALTLMQDDVPITIKSRAKQRNEKDIREIKYVEELTSRKSSSDIPEILDSLNLNYEDDGFVDILLASNMISVGVDIPRLGLMIVNGQPKTTSEYIQATSRVGRDKDGPGLIITLFNHNKVRDRSFYETFPSWHSTLYRSVEPTSVTPFAPRAREKALHAPIIAIMRLSKKMQKPILDKYNRNIIENDLLPYIKQRIMDIDENELIGTLEEITKLLNYWEFRNDIKYFWNDKNYKQSLLTTAEKEVSRIAVGKAESNAIPTPTSVRNVEASVPYRIIEKLKSKESQ